MVPAQERLHTHDIPGHDLDLRLIEQLELALVDRGFELFSDGDALPNFLVQILGVKMILVAARVLGASGPTLVALNGQTPMLAVTIVTCEASSK